MDQIAAEMLVALTALAGLAVLVLVVFYKFYDELNFRLKRHSELRELLIQGTSTDLECEEPFLRANDAFGNDAGGLYSLVDDDLK